MNIFNKRAAARSFIANTAEQIAHKDNGYQVKENTNIYDNALLKTLTLTDKEQLLETIQHKRYKNKEDKKLLQDLKTTLSLNHTKIRMILGYYDYNPTMWITPATEKDQKQNMIDYYLCVNLSKPDEDLAIAFINLITILKCDLIDCTSIEYANQDNADILNSIEATDTADILDALSLKKNRKRKDKRKNTAKTLKEGKIYL